MGINLIAKLDHPSNGIELNQYMNIAMTLFSHPSITIGTNMIAAFSQLMVRNNKILESTEVKSIIPALFNILSIKLRKWGSPDVSDCSGIVSQFSLLEFDDHEAYQVEAGKMRGRVTILTRCIVRSDPINAIQHLGSGLTMVSKNTKSEKRASAIAYIESTCSLTFLFLLSLSFKPVSLFLPRSPLSKTPKQVFFNPIKYI